MPQIDKTEDIHNCPRPHTKKAVRSFLGLVGWYRYFIPHFSSITLTLTKTVKNPVLWTEDCKRAFTQLKQHLCEPPVLQRPDFTKMFLVQVDTAAKGVGAMLAQGDVRQERRILYLSCRLLPRETWYSTIENECLANKWALESLRFYQIGREFSLETDH